MDSVIRTLNQAMEAIEMAEGQENLDDVRAALELAKETIQKKIDSIEEV